MAIASVIQVAVSLPADIGLEQAVIRSARGHERKFLNTAFTIQMIRGWLLWILCLGVAFALNAAKAWHWLPSDSVYATPEFPVLLSVVSLSAVITGFQSMKLCIASRSLDVKGLTSVELISQMGTVAVAIVLAWITHSIWAVILGGLAGSMLKTFLSYTWWKGPLDRFNWEGESVRELLHFGKWTSVSSALTGLATNGDRLLLGSWVDSRILGFYSIAFNMAMAFEGIASRLFLSVLLPAFSEVTRQTPDRLREVYFRTRWIVDVGFISMAGFVFSTGDWMVRFMYDARYAPAGVMLQLLSFNLLFTRYGLAQTIYLAQGRPRYLAAISAVRLLSLFILVPTLFYTFGIEGAIMGIALHQFPSALLVFWFNRRYGLNNFYQELVLLSGWPVGWLSGHIVIKVVNALT
jgi:O-antigen/teichoic acid export membrane protein